MLISLVVLTVITALFFLLDKTSQSRIDKDLFKVKDLKAITRFVLKSKDDSTVLKYEGSKWKVNQYDADQRLVTIFFATISNADPKREVALSLRDSIRKEMEQQGIRVSLYDRNEKVKEFIVSGDDSKKETWFLLPGNPTPYIMVIPGYRFWVYSVFELSVGEWRDKRVFNFNWQNFRDLEVRFKEDSSWNFKATFKDRMVRISGLIETDTTKINDYLDAVSLLKASQFLTDNEAKLYDSVYNLSPQLEIDISDIADQHFKLGIFITKKKEVLGKINDGERIIIDTKSLLAISRKKNYFRQK